MIKKGSFSTSYHLRLVILYIYQDGTTASRFKGHESSFKNANILYMYEYAEMLQSESYTPDISIILCRGVTDGLQSTTSE